MHHAWGFESIFFPLKYIKNLFWKLKGVHSLIITYVDPSDDCYWKAAFEHSLGRIWRGTSPDIDASARLGSSTTGRGWIVARCSARESFSGANSHLCPSFIGVTIDAFPSVAPGRVSAAPRRQGWHFGASGDQPWAKPRSPRTRWRRRRRRKRKRVQVAAAAATPLDGGRRSPRRREPYLGRPYKSPLTSGSHLRPPPSPSVPQLTLYSFSLSPSLYTVCLRVYFPPF